VEYQQGLLDKLSDEIKETDQKSKSVAQTVIDTSSDRTRTLAFNYASQALNNSFFLDFLKPPPAEAYNNESEISDHLGNAIRDDFGSLEHFKSTFSAAAMGLSSSGWIWFTCDNKGLTGVVPTFGTGTLLVRSRSLVSPAAPFVLGESIGRSDSKHSSSTQTRWNQPPPASPASGLTPPPSQSSPQKPTTPPLRNIHTTSALASSGTNVFNGKPVGLHGMDYDGNLFEGSEGVLNVSNIGLTVYPLFCVSVYEHAWLSAGYGIWGKEEYLKKFWTVLDWKKVSDAYRKFVPEVDFMK